MDHLPTISIVVPVRNRERTIEKCLQSLVNLDYPSLEIIVVDNGSTDRSLEIISAFPVKLMKEKKRGAYAARNRGLETAQGELFFFIDSDCIAERDLLKKLVRHFTDERIAGVGGQLQACEPTTLTEQFEDFAGIQVFDLPKGLLEWDKNKFLSGAIHTSNALFRKNAIRDVKGFDSDFRSGGDVHLCWQLQRAGYQIYFDPDAVVKHMHRTNLRGLMRQFFKYGVEQPRLLKKQPGWFSYFKLKTYLFPPYEFRCKLPVRMLMTIDASNLFLLGLILTIVSPLFLYLSLFFFPFIFFGTFRETFRIVKKSGSFKWFLFFPFFHLVRNFSFTIGRVLGGVKHRVLAF